MAFVDIIEKVRNQYLSNYSDAIESYKQRHDDITTELLLEVPSDESDKLYRLYRIDITYESQLVDINTDTYLNFEPFEVTIDDELSIQVHPFYWNALEIYGALDLDKLSEFRQWANKWIDPDDQKETDEDGFSGVIHGVTRPEKQGNLWMTSIDLGTAKIKCVWDLLKILKDAGLNEVKVSSFSMLEDEG